MLLGKYLKTPVEAKRYSIEYKDWLDTDEYLAKVQFDLVSTNIEPASISKSPLTSNSTNVQFIVSGGASGQTYTYGVTATTTNGQVKQDTLVISVRAL